MIISVTDDQVFKALADPTRRILLDRLFERDGRTLTELESGLAMTRFGVMKHLRILEKAGLVVTRRSGREKLHFLNPVPIRQIHDRWIDKYTERHVSALMDLKNRLEEQHERHVRTTPSTQVYRIYIRATPQAIWDAITKPEWTRRYGYGTPVEYDLRPGGAYRAFATELMKAMGSPEVAVEGEVLEVDPPRRLVQSWQPRWSPLEGVTRLTYEITEGADGVSVLTVIHELGGAPTLAAMVAGQVENAGGGWNEVLSGLKTLLETGLPLYASVDAGAAR